REEGMDARLGLRLIVEDLDPAILQRRGVVERDLVERSGRARSYGELVNEIDDPYQGEQAHQPPADHDPRAPRDAAPADQPRTLRYHYKAMPSGRLLRCVVAILLAALLAGTAGAMAPAPLLVMISIDGLRPDYVTAADTRGAKVPNLRRFLTEGA